MKFVKMDGNNGIFEIEPGDDIEMITNADTGEIIYVSKKREEIVANIAAQAINQAKKP